MVKYNEYGIEVFCDIDGVLADWDWGVKNLLKLPHITIENYHLNKDTYAPQYYGAIEEYQTDKPRSTCRFFWRDLPLLKGALKLWTYIAPFNPTILTAVGEDKYGAESQKRRWVSWHLGYDVKVIAVKRTVEKCKYANPNCVLIDDQPRSLDRWCENGGLGILYKGYDSFVEDFKSLIKTIES